MRDTRVLVVISILAVGLSLQAAEAQKPADTAKPAQGKAEVKVDKAVAAPAREPRIWVEVNYFGLMQPDGKAIGFPVLSTVIRPTSGNRNGYLATGELDIPGTRVLYGTGDQGYDWAHGFKGAVGAWIDNERKWGVELSGFYVGSDSTDDTVTVADLPADHYLGVPYYNVFTGLEDSAALGVNITGSGLSDGSADFDYKRGAMWGIETRALRNLVRKKSLNLDVSFGFRNLNLGEEFEATYNQLNNGGSTVRLAGFVSGSYTEAFATATDRVEASNHFYGLDLGVRFWYHISRFLLDIEPKVAIGAMHETLDTTGSCRVYDAANTTLFTSNGGFFARPNVVGERSETAFAVVPNVNVRVGVEITKNLQFKVGYEFLYISSMVYASNQLDRQISLPRDEFFGLTGAAASGVSRPFRTDDFMAHGATAGFTIRF